MKRLKKTWTVQKHLAERLMWKGKRSKDLVNDTAIVCMGLWHQMLTLVIFSLEKL